MTLAEYKKSLIDYYRYEFDNCESKRLEREEILSRNYSDQYLNKVISDTYSLAREIFDMETVKAGYCEIELKLDSYSNWSEVISLNLLMGHSSDELYYETNDRIISKYILKKIFGKNIMIYDDVDELDLEMDDLGIVSYAPYPYLYMQNFPNNMEEIKKNIYGISKIKSRF